MAVDIAPHQSGPHVWKAADFESDTSWVWYLTGSEIDELFDATKPHAGASDAELVQLTPKSFILPMLGSRLAALRRQLTDGRGFEIIRGLPLDRFPDRWATAAFAGIGSHLGSLRSQNAAGDLIGHVRDRGANSDDPTTRIYQTTERQTFHTDSSDVVGLLCLNDAARGGESMLISVAAAYNEMSSRNPDLAAALFDEILNEPGLSFQMTLKPGDMQFEHNHSLLHDRTGFLDDPASPRHLLRLWLSVPGDRALPPVFAERFGSIEVGNRGGIMVERESQISAPEPIPFDPKQQRRDYDQP